MPVAAAMSSIHWSTWSLSDDPRDTTSSSFSTLLLLRGRGSKEGVAADLEESANSNVLMISMEGRMPSCLVRLKALLNVGYIDWGVWMTGEAKAPKSRGEGTFGMKIVGREDGLTAGGGEGICWFEGPAIGGLCWS